MSLRLFCGVGMIRSMFDSSMASVPFCWNMSVAAEVRLDIVLIEWSIARA